MRFLFFLFIVMPIVEMALLIHIGGIIGGWATVGLVLLTAMVGMSLLKQQGPATLLRAQQKMQSGAVPAKELVEGIFLAVGGALLLTPGFITDFIGFCCLLPGIRHLIIGFGVKHLVSGRFGNAQFYTGGMGGDMGAGQTDGGTGSSFHHTQQFQQHSRQSSGTARKTHESHVIEGEYTKEDDK